MTQPIKVRVLDILSTAVWAWMNLLLGERIPYKSESGLSVLELGVGLKIEARHFPEQLVELAFDLVALTVIDPKFLMNLFIEVFKKLLASLLDALVNLYF